MPGKKFGAAIAALVLVSGTAVLAAPKSTDVVATVNGEKITKSDLSAMVYEWYSPMAIDEIVDSRLVDQEARKAGVKVTDADVKVKINEMKKTLPPGQDIESALKRSGMTLNHLTSRIRMRIEAEAIIRKSVKVSAKDLDGYRRASHILIRTSTGFTPDGKAMTEAEKAKGDAEAKDKIEKIAKEIDGGLSFADAAKKYSDDPGSKQTGGDLNWFTKDRMVPEFSTAAFSMKKVGEMSQPIKSSYGYHLIKLTGLGSQAKGAELKQIEDGIVQNQLATKLPDWFNSLKAKAKITNTINPVKPAAKAMPVPPSRVRMAPPTPPQGAPTEVPPPPPPAPAQ